MHEIMKSIFPGDLVFDIGANLGSKTESFVSRQASVIAVEPQPSLTPLLMQKFNGIKNVTVIAKGVGAKPDRLKMSISTSNNTLSTFSKQHQLGRFSDNKWDHTETVEIITLDDMIAEYGLPRYIKIDVEGYEETVLRGLSRKSGIISIEFVSEAQVSTRKCLEHLSAIGYSYFNVSLGDLEEFTMPVWCDAETIYDYHASLCNADALCWGDIYAI